MSGIACPSAWRRCRARSATSAPAFRASTGTRAKRFRSSENRELVPFLKELVARRRVTIALHGYTHQDYPGRLRVSGRARSGAARAGWAAVPRRHPGRADFRVRAAAQRVVEARPRGGRAPPGSTCSDRSSRSGRRCGRGIAARSPTGGACARIAHRPAARGRINSSTPTCCATDATREFGCHSLVPGTTRRRARRRVRGSAARRRRFLPGDALLGSRRDAERRAAAVSRSRGAVPDVRVRAGRGAVRVTRWQTTDALGSQGRVALRRGVRRALSLARRRASSRAQPYQRVRRSGCSRCARRGRSPIDALDLGCGTGRYFCALRGVRDARRLRRVGGDARAGAASAATRIESPPARSRWSRAI